MLEETTPVVEARECLGVKGTNGFVVLRSLASEIVWLMNGEACVDGVSRDFSMDPMIMCVELRNRGIFFHVRGKFFP